MITRGEAIDLVMAAQRAVGNEMKKERERRSRLEQWRENLIRTREYGKEEERAYPHSERVRVPRRK